MTFIWRLSERKLFTEFRDCTFSLATRHLEAIPISPSSPQIVPRSA
jgi:hypothetical protein